MERYISTSVHIALLLPLISFFFANIARGKLNRQIILWTCVMMLVGAAAAFDFAFYTLHQSNSNGFNFILWNWINISHDLHANLSINLDMVSGVMGVVVLNVSALVHLYSLGYMSDDEHQEKFMSYLSLFTLFMLILIFSDNLLQLFIGWEGVGLCSYLLIGFWYEKGSANKAAMKAFIVNRIGDVGLIMAMGLLLMTFKSIEFVNILNHERIATVLDQKLCCWTYIDVICLFLFVGCMGKSAQLLLHVWLPDAMEGPTPVSALIHAATMVTAGVFLVVRCSPLFEQSHITLQVITVVGALTAIFAATVALVQNDIKRIIAYSTCSQLGYMFFACGVSAYSQAIFHLFTHAFFKALLFLNAGSVIHGMHGEQDIHKMGGLRKYMPITYVMMLIGSLALAGIYPFAGFFSKDAILESAKAAGTNLGNLAYYAGLAAAFLTAFYSWRLAILVFEGKAQTDHSHGKPHESGLLMITPLIILAIGAVLSGLAGQHIGMIDSSLEFWRGSIFVKTPHQEHHKVENILMQFLPMIVGVIGIAFAYIIYGTRYDLAGKLQKAFKYLHHLLSNAYYFDCLYHYVFVKSTGFISKFLSKIFDNKIIDSVPAALSSVVQIVGTCIKAIHNGNVQNYIMMMFLFISIALLQLFTEKLESEFWIIAATAIIFYLGLMAGARNKKQIQL